MTNCVISPAYRTEECKPWVLPVVREAEKQLAGDETLTKEYLPVLGLESFTSAATSMLLGGKECAALTDGRVSIIDVILPANHIYLTQPGCVWKDNLTWQSWMVSMVTHPRSMV